jgi:hypothetical protein
MKREACIERARRIAILGGMSKEGIHGFEDGHKELPLVLSICQSELQWQQKVSTEGEEYFTCQPCRCTVQKLTCVEGLMSPILCTPVIIISTVRCSSRDSLSRRHLQFVSMRALGMIETP